MNRSDVRNINLNVQVKTTLPTWVVFFKNVHFKNHYQKNYTFLDQDRCILGSNWDLIGSVRIRRTSGIAWCPEL